MSAITAQIVAGARAFLAIAHLPRPLLNVATGDAHTHPSPHRSLALYSTSAAAESSWKNPIIDFLERGILPKEKWEANMMRRDAANYVTVGGELYRRAAAMPLFKCVEKE
ncbi:hypothetical protein PIB30_038273 [Stylosanthes scabra]|uniref:Uncharacterized protein n=1 Tax=Stylosanthes scabra TaxID=79078 RepID=A0ABU6YE83_9FABA|nr:hypothetical protein [Stylosanthes scabra]